MNPTGRPFSVATWNVNSLRMRSARVLAWLEQHQPDVLCLQELKMETAQFPAMEYAARGYQSVVLGQKTYNGVAILYRQEHGPAQDVDLGFAETDGEEDAAARLCAATLPGLGLRAISAYVPNGQVVGSEKFDYKLRWLGRLRRYLDARCDPAAPLVVCGDFNVAPDDRDVYDPPGWADTVICHPAARSAFQAVLGFGLRDSLRLLKQEAGIYTYWDYRMLAFPKNQGLRIDHVLCSAALAPLLTGAATDRQARKGPQPSDHAPFVAYFNGAAPRGT